MKNLLLIVFMALSFTACNGGGGGNGGGSGSYSHNELAEIFVDNLNLDADFDVTLVKKSTLHADYIVIYDPYTDTYDAIDIRSYNPNHHNAADYYYDYAANMYTDLEVIPGHYELQYDYVIVDYDSYGNAIYGYDYYDVWVPTRYHHYNSGVTFEKVKSTPKDLAKVAALKEVAELDKKAKFLSKELGLSFSRSKEVVRLESHWKKASMKGMTNDEQDAFSTELLGFSISAGKQAAKEAAEGNATSLNSLVKDAASKNNITPEHASKLMTKLFSM